MHRGLAKRLPTILIRLLISANDRLQRSATNEAFVKDDVADSIPSKEITTSSSSRSASVIAA
jgi:hypothetical protein